MVASCPGWAQGTTIKATVDRRQILIGEPIVLSLEVDVPENEPIRFFQLDSIAHFEFLEKNKIDTVNTGTGTVLKQVIRLTSFDSGHWVIPAMVLAEKMQTDSFPVDVGFSSPFDPTQPYHDTKDIILVNPPPEKDNRLWYALAGSVIVLILLIYLLRRKKKKVVVTAIAPPVDPYAEALKKIGTNKEYQEPTDETILFGVDRCVS